MFLDASLRGEIDDSTDFDQFCSDFDQFCSDLDFENWYVIGTFVL